MKSVMLDTETLGVSTGCAVLSIGAVEFDNKGLGKEFEVYIDLEDSVRNGFQIEPRTVLWWLDQNEEARKHITQAKGVPLLTALSRFTEAFDWKGKQVWCNGASFDFPIIDALYRSFNLPTPWMYWNTNDYRTLKNLFDAKTYGELKVDATVKHSALADAKAQALTAINLLKHMRGE